MIIELHHIALLFESHVGKMKRRVLGRCDPCYVYNESLGADVHLTRRLSMDVGDFILLG